MGGIMATYDYYCSECDCDQEEVHGMTETPVITCPTCSTKMSKVIRSSNFQLKGSGWFGKSKQN
jgi:putative FmdB family regulatory protein